MDLLYLKEFKQDVFRSDFDEFTFTMFMLLDVTRQLAERDEGLKQLQSDRVKMNRAFGGSLRSKIGIIVPFERSVQAFNQLFDDAMRAKLGIISEDEIFVGTPDMFRGVDKDIIIITGVRNSVVDGLGQLDEAEYVKLALTRARHFVWMVCSSITLIGQNTPGASLINTFIRGAQTISVGGMQNYYAFSDFREWKSGGLSAIIQKMFRPSAKPSNGSSPIPRGERRGDGTSANRRREGAGEAPSNFKPPHAQRLPPTGMNRQQQLEQLLMSRSYHRANPL